MSRRLHQYSIAVLAASVQAPFALTQFSFEDPSASDPYRPRNRSKGEKARNRKARGGRA